MKKIYFIYPRAHKNAGSTVMRVFQTKELLDKYGQNNFCVKTVSVSNLRSGLFWELWARRFEKNSIAIFCKHAIDRLPNYVLRKLKSRGIKIALDYVDREISGIRTDFVDIHIASCQRQLDFINSLDIGGKKILIPHYGDLRAYEKKTYSNIKLKNIYYLGEIRNLFLPAELIPKVDVFNYNGIISDQTLDSCSNYKFQYCIRPKIQNDDLNCFKPPTKVMNSIALGNLPIVSADQDDAIRILGTEYPFQITNYTIEEFFRIFNLIDNGAYNIEQELLRLNEIKKRYLPNFVCRDMEKVFIKISKE